MCIHLEWSSVYMYVYILWSSVYVYTLGVE